MKIIEIRDNPDDSMVIDVDLLEEEVRVIIESTLKKILEEFIDNPKNYLKQGNENEKEHKHK